ncbi:MAG TPA: hypothetical protein PKL13_05185, partial [bacterium]|nr:hypothetical protein [bacterium]
FIGENIKASLAENFPLFVVMENKPTTIILKDNKYYFIQGEETFEQIKNGSIPNLDNVEDYQFVLDKNLKVGDKWLNDEERKDDYYCYLVEDIIKTIYKKYIISYYTLSDLSRTEFIPGIGIGQDYYNHNGTVEEWYTKLVDYNIK